MHKLKILICDDMEHVRNSHEHHVHQVAGSVFRPVTELVSSAEEAVAAVKDSRTAPYDLALLDVDFGQDGEKMDGFAAANEIHRISPSTIIVMISAYSTKANLTIAEGCPWVEKFFRRGSFSKTELYDACVYALIRRLHGSGELLSAEDVAFTQSPVMEDYLKKVDRVGAELSVVIFGETGTGKELTAKRLNANARVALGQAQRPLVSINCGGLTETLRVSELFGYVRGAFTGATQDTPGLLEKAEGGDVFLDELQNTPQNLQEILLRVLDTKEFTPVGGRKAKKLNVRFITALNQSPMEAKKSKTLREDLVARLQQNYLVIPPLRERRGDISSLVAHFKSLEGKVDKTFSTDALNFLEDFSWPTNVRGLKNVVKEAIRHTKVPIITTDSLKGLASIKELLTEAEESRVTEGESRDSSLLSSKLEELALLCLDAGVPVEEPGKVFEKIMLSRLWQQDPSILRVARRAKMPETTARRKLAEYGIS